VQSGRKILTSTISLLFILLFSNNCGGGEKKQESDNNKIPNADKSTYEVEYTDNTVVIDEDVMESFVSADKKSGDYTFTSDADDLLDLKPGKIVFFYGHSVRRIKSVAEKGDDIIVYTEYVTLNEAIKNGSIGWENKIDWSSDQPEVRGASLLIGDELYAAQETSEFNIHYEGKIQGWDISLDLLPKDNKLTIDITGTKEIGGQKVCSISGKGFISQFTNECHFRFADSNLESFEMVNHGLNGELELKFAAVGLGSQVAQLEIPAKIKIPTRVYGIPVSFNLGCNLKIFPEVAQGASSQASYKITYDSDMGFKFANNNAEATSKLNSQNMEVTGETVSAGAITTGVGVGLEFPRIEVAVLGEIIVPYFLYNTSIITFYEPGIASNVPPCQEGKMTIKCVSGIDLKFFGASYAFSKDHFEKVKKWQTEGSHCED
jgi:hypothetical protein